MQPSTIIDVVAEQAARRPERPQHYSWRDGGWQGVSWRDAWRRYQEIAAGLCELGVAHGDRVAVVSPTRAEWAQADYGIYLAGGVVVGVYPTSSDEEVRYILRHSSSAVAFVDSEAQRARLERLRAELPALRHVVGFDVAGEASLGALLERGRAALAREPSLVDRRRAELKSDDPATLVYTSGTTGTPKGALLTHANLVAMTSSVLEAFKYSERDSSVIALPLAHVLQRVSSYTGMRALITGYYARSLETQAEAWQQTHPTTLSSVPRILERVQARVTAAVAAMPERRRRLVAWAMRLGAERAKLVHAGSPVPLGLRLRYALADRAVLARLRGRVFGRRLRFIVCGSAPLDATLHAWFEAIGVMVLEGYGLTETTAGVACNLPESRRAGTVGRPLPGVEVRIAADGEVLVRSRGLFREYYRDDETTRAALDADGWFHTGDLGELDADGFLRLTGRKKDLLITSGGKNVAPQKLEARLTADAAIAQAVVLGDRRPYLVALLGLDPEWLSAEGLEASSPRVAEHVARVVAGVNADLARYETIKHFRVLPEPLSIEAGTLTATLKVKRNVVAEHYAALVDAMYAERPAPAA